jgi:membrane protein implicated in regulation of membrane protease activity
MDTVFFVLFGVGLGYSVIAFIFGNVLNAADVDTDFSVGGTVSPLKPTVIAAFITAFGGSGLILARIMPPYGSLPLAGLVGVGVAFALFKLVVVPLSKAQNTSTVEIQSLIGHPAKVTIKIPQGKFGKIVYRVDGNTYSAPARAEDGKEIRRDAEVEIVYIENNTYFVRTAA